MTLPDSIVASPATRAIARQIITDTQWDGAEATLRHLPDLHPTQIPALIHLLAAAAATGDIPTSPAATTRKPLLLTEDERRRAHARFVAGATDPATRRGEQEYQRARRRIQRTQDGAA
ncbi:hypothetical protein NPS01_25240 [Nocardioides psychrotolerans]|uniref:Uncharacterized protein n=1 Tax=Nocardioides psychrotolerans TaxID=1005945 RepID=A0A1I3LM58_9ACTN|nr:hypothetical protein [Nocardioides psychrotolerans]GEP38861.1 hypothetical protein NPS01_25240 [Nocardioides psychrotolerans]SFI85838.1 hypothetical protein SAMN05216561_11427 [Nocardioides psychrotolerans]